MATNYYPEYNCCVSDLLVFLQKIQQVSIPNLSPKSSAPPSGVSSTVLGSATITWVVTEGIGPVASVVGEGDGMESGGERRRATVTDDGGGVCIGIDKRI